MAALLDWLLSVCGQEEALEGDGRRVGGREKPGYISPPRSLLHVASLTGVAPPPWLCLLLDKSILVPSSAHSLGSPALSMIAAS